MSIPKFFNGKETFKKCNPSDFKFYLRKLKIKIFPIWCNVNFVFGLNVSIFQIHDRDIQDSTIINREFERKPKAYRVHLHQQQINLLNIVIWQKLKQT